MIQFIKFDQFDILGGLIGRQHVIYDLKWLQEQHGVYTDTTYFPGWTTTAMKQHQQQQQPK